MDKRRTSLGSFLIALVVYPISLVNTFGAIGKAGLSHGPSGGIAHVEQMWRTGRVLACLAALLLMASIVLGFLTPPERGKRLWWVLTSTIFLIGIVYFDFLQIGFS